MPATRIPGQNPLESLPPAERPQEAVSQLRDIAAWLRDEDMGEIELADDADRLADDLRRPRHHLRPAMLTPTDLLAAGFRFFHPEHHGARPLYQRIETGPSGEHLYHINIEDYEAALRSTGASLEVAASNRWSTKAHIYLDTDTFVAVAYSVRPTTTAAEIVAFYARAYAALGCVPDPLN